MGPWPNNGNCERCKTKTSIMTMSMFNTQMCCEQCIEKERKHPKYKEAVKTELKEIKSGNTNFPGIGLPDELLHR
jgi:hypothetical protein